MSTDVHMHPHMVHHVHTHTHRVIFSEPGVTTHACLPSSQGLRQENSDFKTGLQSEFEGSRHLSETLSRPSPQKKKNRKKSTSWPRLIHMTSKTRLCWTPPSYRPPSALPAGTGYYPSCLPQTQDPDASLWPAEKSMRSEVNRKGPTSSAYHAASGRVCRDVCPSAIDSDEHSVAARVRAFQPCGWGCSHAASDTFLKSKHWDPSREGGGLESGTCGPEGGEQASGALGLMEKHMAFTPRSEGGGLGSGLLNSGVRRTYSFLTLVRFCSPPPPSQECPLTCSLSLVVV